MAIKRSENRKKLIDGCGSILKVNRLKGGYRLVKREKSIGESAEKSSAPAKRRGRPAKAKALAPAKRRGRPAKAKASVPAKAKVSAPAKRRGRRKTVKA